MSELLRYVVEHLVKNKDSVKITSEDKDGEENLTLSVAQEDMGKVIGRSGRTAKDIRCILRAAAGARINLEIVEQAEHA
ncbi:UPF0109 protein [Clostridia bacterium]|nr:UPF0109 protein [Clostridia bacterium]